MDFWEMDLDTYIDRDWHYKRSLVHKQLNNKPIFVEARDFNELTEKMNRAKYFLCNEWFKFEFKKEHENYNVLHCQDHLT